MPIDTDSADMYTECLTNARLTALRALLDVVNTTDDPVEKRHAATAILRAPDPNAQPPARAPRHAAPTPPPRPHHPPSPRPAAYPLPRSTHDIDELLTSAESFLNEQDLIDSVADLPDLADLNFPASAAAILAASAGLAPPPISHNGAP